MQKHEKNTRYEKNSAQYPKSGGPPKDVIHRAHSRL